MNILSKEQFLFPTMHIFLKTKVDSFKVLSYGGFSMRRAVYLPIGNLKGEGVLVCCAAHDDGGIASMPS